MINQVLITALWNSIFTSKRNFVFMSKKNVIYCKFLSNLIDREFPRSALVLGTQCYSAQASWSQCETGDTRGRNTGAPHHEWGETAHSDQPKSHRSAKVVFVWNTFDIWYFWLTGPSFLTPDTITLLGILSMMVLFIRKFYRKLKFLFNK